MLVKDKRANAQLITLECINKMLIDLLKTHQHDFHKYYPTSINLQCTKCRLRFSLQFEVIVLTLYGLLTQIFL